MLVVEDNAMVARTLARTLAALSCTCETVDSIGSARARLQAGSFDLVIVDANLGDERGQDLVAEVRETFPEITTVLTSGAGSDTVDQEAARCGAHQTLVKPFTLEALLEVVSGARVVA